MCRPFHALLKFLYRQFFQSKKIPFLGKVAFLDATDPPVWGEGETTKKRRAYLGTSAKGRLSVLFFGCGFFSDRKVKILKGRFGADGITYYLYLLCEIYKGHGYYLEVDEDFDYITSSELGMSHAKIGQMRKFLLERSLFDNKLFSRTLSSRPPQYRDDFSWQ